MDEKYQVNAEYRPNHMKKALEELSNSWSQVATKMYDGANQEGQQQEAPSSDDKKEKNKDEIEDADFEVVD